MGVLKQIWLYNIYGDILLISQNTTMQVCRYMEYGLKNIAFYFQKHIAHRTVCYNFLLVHDKPLGVPIFVKLVYWHRRLWSCYMTGHYGVNHPEINGCLIVVMHCHKTPMMIMAQNCIWPTNTQCKYCFQLIIPPETKFRGGILDSPCSSVRPSVRPSVRGSVSGW